MVNSLFNAMVNTKMPITIKKPELGAQLAQIFPEIKLKYGVDAVIITKVSLKQNNTNNAIKFDTV